MRSMNDHPLKKFRAGLKLTLRQMAAETGSSAAALSRIETRKQDPDMDLLRQLSALAARRGQSIRIDEFLSFRPVKETME